MGGTSMWNRINTTTIKGYLSILSENMSLEKGDQLTFPRQIIGGSKGIPWYIFGRKYTLLLLPYEIFAIYLA